MFTILTRGSFKITGNIYAKYIFYILLYNIIYLYIILFYTLYIVPILSCTENDILTTTHIGLFKTEWEYYNLLPAGHCSVCSTAPSICKSFIQCRWQYEAWVVLQSVLCIKVQIMVIGGKIDFCLPFIKIKRVSLQNS